MNTNRSLFLSIFASILCVAISVVCAIVLNFNLVSIILLASIVVTTIIASVLCWRIAVAKNRKK